MSTAKYNLWTGNNILIFLDVPKEENFEVENDGNRIINIEFQKMVAIVGKALLKELRSGSYICIDTFDMENRLTIVDKFIKDLTCDKRK